ncbi:hypothetical protein BVRB_2g034700 [Beta vulgaris subsp. vulgaris]|nr:hypothetical protein BVRB_2g034700 [Beta vulgaris subsp. vulgaris]
MENKEVNKEVKDVVIKAAKEVGPSSIKCPMLNNTNYTVWAMRMKVALKVHKVWETIDPGTKDDDKNNMAMSLLFQSIPEALFLQVGDLESSKGIWDAIKARHVGADRVKEARLQTLTAEFDRLKMKETDKIDDFVGKISELSSKSVALGEAIEESKLVKKFLKSLPRKRYIHIVASLEQVLDLKTTSFEDIVGRLKAYEERISEEEEVEDQTESDNQGKLMYTNTDSSRFQQDKYGGNRGRGRGGRPQWGGRGRGRYGNYQRQDKESIVCYRCDKKGHYASECPDRLLKLQEAMEKKDDDTHEADELMMHEIMYLNENKVQPSIFEGELDTEKVWYLDNSASNHMCGNRRFFFDLDETITGKVRFGDDSRVDIKGKGSIRFLFKNGERKTLNNIYYIPELRSNIISLGQATEAGCEVRMKGNQLMLYNPSGQILVKTNRLRNRLYKVILEVESVKCLQLTISTESSKWHARLGHVNSKTMKLMINNEVVTGIPRIVVDKETCESCLRGKQTRQSFPQFTSYRASHALELVHGDLCGPITPCTPAHKRVATRSLAAQTPYEALKGRRPNLEHLRIFGSIGYTRTETVGRKKLDDRSKKLIYLGTEPGTKAYRLLDPATLKITLSRDVIFDENKCWIWGSVEGEASRVTGDFTITFGEFGNRGISESERIIENEGVDRYEEGDDTQVEGNNEDNSDTELGSEAGDSVHETGGDLDQVPEEKWHLLVVAVYVDDLLVTGSTLDIVLEFKKEMATKFEMSDLGKLTYYLGIEVLQHRDGITLKQEKYASKVLEDAGMSECNTTHVPMDQNVRLSKGLEESCINERNYRRSIGCLRYLLHTRPDLSFSVGVLSRYMQEPKESHGAALKQVLRYLRGTLSNGLVFKRSNGKGTGLVGYSDSSHNVDMDDGKSTTGHIFYFDECPITWCSQKQETVALSSCEAEFMAATEAAKQAIWLQELVTEVTGNLQKADILTKALGKTKFKEMKSLIGVQDIKEDYFKLKGENVVVSLK